MGDSVKGVLKMTHVVFVPTSKFNLFNLFSLTRLMINKWIIGGDEKSTWLEKGGIRIVFDIKITTRTGVIYYCAYCHH
jgi:hypothetical protein